MTDKSESIKHPRHYTNSNAKCKYCGIPIECIDITSHMNFNLGNAIKYIWRCDLKTEDATVDIRKAIEYLDFELARRSPDHSRVGTRIASEPMASAYVYGTHGSGNINLGVEYDDE